MKKITILFLFLSIFAISSCKTEKVSDLMTTKVSKNDNVKEYNYLEAKAKALEAVSLKDYNPLILNASYSQDGYDFVFYPLELRKIFTVNVKRYSGVAAAKTFRNITSYDYIDPETYYLSADLALNIALNDAGIEQQNGYSYRVWMEPFDGVPVYFAVFADDKNEYRYTISAYLEDQKIMSKDIIAK